MGRLVWMCVRVFGYVGRCVCIDMSASIVVFLALLECT